MKHPIPSVRLLRLTLLPALVFMGCSTTTVVQRGEEFNLEDPGVLITKGGKHIRLQHAHLEDDSIAVLDAREGQAIRVPMSEAEKIEVRKHGKGALDGMLLFAAAGAVLGAIPDPNCGDPCLFPNGGIGGSLFWAVLAAPVGAVVGGVAGSREDYVFKASTRDTVGKQ